MAFSQATITGDPTVRFSGSDLVISWSSSSPAGTIFQAYIDGVLLYSGTSTFFPMPYIEPDSSIQVGTVGAGEAKVDFSGSLTPIPGKARRPFFEWYGGRYLDEDLAGFRIYRSPAAGAPVGSEPIATVLATDNGQWRDGFGLGRFGYGGFGRSEIHYAWTGSPLANGTWDFEIRPYDDAGNEGDGESESLVIETAPRPPALNGEGKRLASVYNSTTRVAVLSWLASPA